MNFFLFSVFYVAWMVLYNLTAEHVTVDVGIYFRGGDAFVPQHALDGAQVGAAFQQVGGERMPERMRADVLGNSRFLGQFFDEVKNHDARDAVTPSGQKHIIFISRLYSPMIAVKQPMANFLDGAGGDGD